MGYDPFADASDKVDRQRNDFALGVAEVTSVEADRTHAVAIQPLTRVVDETTVTDAEPATVLAAQKGDVALPSEGDLVVFGRFSDEETVVLGTLYGYRDQVREYDPDERHVGAEDGGGVFMHGPFGVAPRLSADPSDPPEGAVWYRTDLDEYRGVEGTTTVSFDTTDV